MELELQSLHNERGSKAESKQEVEVVSSNLQRRYKESPTFKNEELSMGIARQKSANIGSFNTLNQYQLILSGQFSKQKSQNRLSFNNRDLLEGIAGKSIKLSATQVPQVLSVKEPQNEKNKMKQPLGPRLKINNLR